MKLPEHWRLRPYQEAAWAAWQSGIRRSLLVWHRRAGKDEIALYRTAVAAHRRIANYWHCLPMYEQGRKAVWEAVNPHTGRRRIDEAFPPELRARTDSQSMLIELKCGSTWRVVGSDNVNALVGAPPAGIVFSEWALSDPAAWAYLAPILAENGGWADFVTTPRGRNHVKAMLDMARADPAWFAQVLTVKDTGVIPLDAVEAHRREVRATHGQEAGDALIEQEYWCSFDAPVVGAYWGRLVQEAEAQGRLGSIDPDPRLPVHTAWDLGVGDSTAIWCFQATPSGPAVVDFLEASGYAADHYAAWLDERGYHGTDWVPQDARVREWTSAGEGGRAKTRVQTLIELGRRPRLVPAHKVDDGINAARRLLPRCRFDAARCERGLDALRQYRAHWDEDARRLGDRPCHDWTSHAADAFRYLAMAWRELAVDRPEPERPMRGLGEMTFDEILSGQDEDD